VLSTFLSAIGCSVNGSAILEVVSRREGLEDVFTGLTSDASPGRPVNELSEHIFLKQFIVLQCANIR